MATRLLFVYNADSGIGNAVIDALHKVISPGTYSCDLCKITYGITSMKGKWKAFLTHLELETVFVYRDQWQVEFKRSDKLPAIFIHEEESITQLLFPEDFRKMELDELIVRLQQKLSAYQSRRPVEN